MKKFICPYCQTEHDINSCVYKCSLDITGNTVKKCKHSIKKDNDKNIMYPVDDLKRCLKCTEAAILLFCKITGKEIPIEFLEMENLPIALLGAKASGKSNYIGVLINEIRNNMSDPFSCSLSMVSSPESNQAYMENYYRPLFEQGYTVKVTDAGKTPPPLIFPLKFMDKKNKFVNMTALTFYDTAGENLDKIDEIQKFNQYILNARGIILLLDPLQVPIIREILTTNGYSGLPPQNKDTSLLLDTIINVLRNIKKIKGLINIPLALVFTKIDVLEQYNVLPQDSCLRNESKHIEEGNFMLDEFENTKIEMKDLLDNWIGQDLYGFIRQFKDYSFFGVTALGANPKDGQKIEGSIKPRRVLDPLLWLLAEKNYIKSLKNKGDSKAVQDIKLKVIRFFSSIRKKINISENFIPKKGKHVTRLVAIILTIITLGIISVWVFNKHFSTQEKSQSTKIATIQESTQTQPITQPPPISSNMVRLQGGSFMMGSPTNEHRRGGDESPQHQVTVNSFNISKYEVTVGEFSRFVNSKGYRTEAETGNGGFVWTEVSMGQRWEMKPDANWRNPYFKQEKNHPVVLVSWNDAIRYCNWLSEQEGLTLVYKLNGNTVTWDRNANGYRLPTEAEWEFACRALSNTAFYTGNDITVNQANFDNKLGGTSPVGSYPPNGWGLYDMHGNVVEWCWDWYGFYSGIDQVNPIGVTTGDRRVARGGSWIFSDNAIRSAHRGDRYAPNYRFFHLGFRVVQSDTTITQSTPQQDTTQVISALQPTQQPVMQYAGESVQSSPVLAITTQTSQTNVQTTTQSSHSQEQNIIETIPITSEEYGERGRSFFNNKNYDQAISDYSEAIRIKPHLNHYVGRGLAYYQKGDYDRAIFDYTEAMSLTNNNNDKKGILYFRALFFSKKGDKDNAIMDYEAALRIDPNYEKARDALNALR